MKLTRYLPHPPTKSFVTIVGFAAAVFIVVHLYGRSMMNSKSSKLREPYIAYYESNDQKVTADSRQGDKDVRQFQVQSKTEPGAESEKLKLKVPEPMAGMEEEQWPTNIRPRPDDELNAGGRTEEDNGPVYDYIKSSRDTDKQPALSELRKTAVAHGLVHVDLEKMTSTQLFHTMHTYLDNIDVICRHKLRMGHVGEGGWEVCDDPAVRPTPPCIVYSYGISNDFSFDDDISTLYGCHVYAFDPSTDFGTHNRSDLVHFYKAGISGQTIVDENGWQLFNHRELRVLMGHRDTPIDVIKMDVEKSEWGALEDMISTDQFRGVKQFYVEFHVRGGKSTLLPRLKIIQSLEALGFRRFYTHKNKDCKLKDRRFPTSRTYCYEVHYIRH